MIKKFYLLTLLFWLHNTGYGSVSTMIRSDSEHIAASDSSIYIQINNEKFLHVKFISPSIFRVQMNNQNVFPEGGMVKYGMVGTKYQGHQVKIIEKENIIELITHKATLSIDKKNGKIKLLDTQGDILTQNVKPPKSNSEQGFELTFTLEDGERLYGTGDVSRDGIQKRGHQYQMTIRNIQSYIPIPFIMSDRNWGLFMNTTMIHSFDAGANVSDRLSIAGNRGILDYYLIAGESMIDVLDNYTDITGKPHILPKWGYGLIWVSLIDDTRERDIVYEAYEFRKSEIPCDVFGLEPGWMENFYDYSTKKGWSKDRFPMMNKSYLVRGTGTFVDALENMGFKLSLWLCTDYDFSGYEETKLLFDNQDIHYKKILGAPDEAEAIDIEPWFQHLEKFVDDGASMFKLDGDKQVTLKFTPERRWANGMDDFEMLNLYPMLYNKQMSLGFKEYTGKRAMIFSAGGYAGIQRYSATWAGDTGGDEKTLISLLGHGLSGHSNVCTDMDVSTESGIHYGFFQTLSQVSGWAWYIQPWFLGEKKASMFKEYARLRYKLIPYIYSMAHLASEKSIPVMRAMPLVYPDDPQCNHYIPQYMFGDAFLVSISNKTVYLPEGEWIDYWTKKRWPGKQEIPAEFPEDKGGALFVKAGAIIPTQSVRSHIGTETPENITWEIFPKNQSEFILYEDDGESYNYLNGEIVKTVVECSETDENIRITIHPRAGKYENMPEKRSHSFKIFYAGRKMMLKNENIIWNYDSNSGVLHIENVQEKSNEINLLIEFI